jgi:hypothetical protein
MLITKYMTMFCLSLYSYPLPYVETNIFLLNNMGSISRKLKAT